MLPEILNITIADWIQAKVPSDYNGYKDTIQKSNTEQKKIEDFLKLKGLDENKVSSLRDSEISSTDDEVYQFKTASLPQASDFSIRHFSECTESSSQSSHKESSGE